MKLLAAIAVISVFTACMTEQKATDYLQKHGQLARICADIYPPTVTPGKVVHTSDTMYTPGPVVPCPPGAINPDTGLPDTVYIKCPPGKIVRDSIIQHDTIENFARIVAQRHQIDSLITESGKHKADADKAEKQARNRLFYIIGLCGLIAGSIFLKLKSII
jgi:hypothetical protein